MPVPVYTVSCLRHATLAPGVWEFTLEKPGGFSFKPGQFILFDTPLVDNPTDIQPRAFSIGSTPNEKDLLFLAKNKEGGRASRWIEEVVRPGVPVTFKGPFGFFTVDPQSERDFLFVATGSGIAPFRTQIRHLLESGCRKRIDLVFGVRTEADLFWEDAFKALAQQYDNFFLHLALSGPTPEWKGHKGRVQTLAPLIAQDIAQRNVYVCGSPDMTKELKTLCLGQWGVPKEWLHVEGYI